LGSRARSLVSAIKLQGRAPAERAARRRPAFVLDIFAADGSELPAELLRQGVFPEEVILKYCWPRYAPPADAGIRAILKSENLAMQFERLLAMHRELPSSVPMPLAAVKSPQGEFAGYILEYVTGDTLVSLLQRGMIAEARRQVDRVEVNVARLQRKNLPHGDINASNIIAADDGRTVLIDPIPRPHAGTRVQDQLCLRQLREQIEAAGRLAPVDHPG
jgi:hypothetical protein